MDWFKLKVFIFSEDENKWVHVEVILPYDENTSDEISYYKKFRGNANKFIVTEPITGSDDWRPLKRNRVGNN